MLTFDQAQPGTQIECICSEGTTELTLRAVYTIKARIDKGVFGWGLLLIEVPDPEGKWGFHRKRFRLPRAEALDVFKASLAISKSAISIWEYIKETNSHAD